MAKFNSSKESLGTGGTENLKKFLDALKSYYVNCNNIYTFCTIYIYT